MNELIQMFDSYAKEKGFGPRVLHIPEVGFATYHLHKDECYIEDIYIVPEKRKSGEGSKIADAIVSIAKELDIKLLTGSVVPHANGSTESTKALLTYGFKVHSIQGESIFFSKEI